MTSAPVVMTGRSSFNGTVGIGTLRIPSPHRGRSRGPVRLLAIGQPSGLAALPNQGPCLGSRREAGAPRKRADHASSGSVKKPTQVSRPVLSGT